MSDMRLIDANQVSRVLRRVEDHLLEAGNHSAWGAVVAIRERIDAWPTVEPVAMTINDYQQDVLRTAADKTCGLPMWLNGALGLTGESGEIADMVKKHLFQGHPIDFDHMAKELGDVAWYIALTAHAIGYDLETILQMNVDKRRKRYPNGFEAERSLHREEGDV